MEKKFIKLKITGSETSLMEFLRFCGVVQWLGNVGSSRSLNMFVDGDGAAHLTFTDLSNEEKIKSIPFEDDKDEMRFDLG